MNRRFTLRALAAVTAGAALALAAPLAASAHVRISPDTAEAGGYTYVTFRVPTESATASTTKLVIELPTDTPFTSVSFEAVPGWTAKVTNAKLPKPVDVGGSTIKEAPRTITFTATGSGIAPGQFGQFTVSLGKVPDTGKVLLPATQTYSDGTVVKWDEPTPASGDEPEHPAPTLYIDDAPPAGDDGSTVTASPEAAPATATESDGTATAALVIGVAGVVIGAAGLVTAVVALTRRRAS
ncbi:YcnI family copper-binding membrane protein [Gryllotalpicola ginsengisoli]|uniref:YcnI family copper-binding membrane protein n=1 Tax=Gryllotalpicola ginsengisoli TaxID=444608 RepID=UPI0003B48FC7|nr:YcnI family protein [Gryllotalpicola ginsengisoli]